jgi:hypothetical protein
MIRTVRICWAMVKGFDAMVRHSSRPARLVMVALLALVLGSVFLSPVQSLWSKNVVIRGEVETREVPDRCKDMHFDSYLWGTDGDDWIHGTGGNDMIWGLKGHDSIYGHGGDDCFDGGDDEDRCDDHDGWHDANDDHSWFNADWGEHESRRNSCDQWGSHFFTFTWWHHSTPTIELEWNAVDGAVYYNVYRGTESGGPYEGIASTEAPAYTDTDIIEDTTYYYVVTAVDAEGFESVPSAEAAQLVPSGGSPEATSPPPQAPAPPPDAPTPPETSAPDATAGPSPAPAETAPPEETASPTPAEEVPAPTPIDTPLPPPEPTPPPPVEAPAPLPGSPATPAAETPEP